MVGNSVEIDVDNKKVVGTVTKAGISGTVWEVESKGVTYVSDSNGNFKEKK